MLLQGHAADGAAETGDVPAGLADLQQVPVTDGVPAGGAHRRLRLAAQRGHRSEVRSVESVQVRSQVRGH